MPALAAQHDDFGSGVHRCLFARTTECEYGFGIQRVHYLRRFSVIVAMPCATWYFNGFMHGVHRLNQPGATLQT
jgi:hypothetical protein